MDPAEDLVIVLVLVPLYVDKVMRAEAPPPAFLKIAAVAVELAALAPPEEQLIVLPLVVLVVLVEHHLSQVLL